LLLTKEVEVTLGARNINYYEELGYKIPREKNKRGKISALFGEIIIVKITDLPKNSNVNIKVQCDYCNKIITKKYYKYTNNKENSIIKKDCCAECQPIKTKESNMIKYNTLSTNQLQFVKNKKIATSIDKYGCISPMQNKEVRNKVSNTNLDRIGYENVLSSKVIREKSKKTCREKYGFEYAIQNPEIQAKRTNTLYQNGTCPTSSQQLEIYNILKENNYTVELNYPLSNINLDVAIFIDDIKIDLEYDCYHWHKDQQKDRKRDEFTKSQGWKILRIKSGHKIPSLEQIIESINKLVSTDRTFTQIILDDWQEDSLLNNEINKNGGKTIA